MKPICGLMIVQELLFQTYYKHELEHEGISLSSVSNVRLAIDRLKLQHFDLIFMDIDRQSPESARIGLERLKDHTSTPLVIIGSCEAMSQLLRKSKSNTDGLPPNETFVIKDSDLSELRIALDVLIPSRAKYLSSAFYNL